MATVLWDAKVCDSPIVDRVVDDSGWLHVVHECGCSRTYGKYQGIGCRTLLSTTLCDAACSVCPECHKLTYPWMDCVCSEKGIT
jgi:hypothetical protein